MSGDIHIRKEGRAGRITLTRPKALNALSYAMCTAIEAALDGWRDDDDVALVVIDAEGDRAFCAGGDIQQLYDTGRAGDFAYGRRFWADEYRLNAKIARYPKPYVALKVGPYTAGDDVDYGPVVTAEAKARILGLVESGIAQGADLVVDGRDFSLQGYESGFFVGPHLFDRVTPEMDIYRQEIFGPVLSTVRAGSYEEALKLAMDHEYGNGTAIFTRDGDAARDFAHRINIGMVGINVPIPVPLAYHTFGGWKKSGFGDLNQHGPDAFKFYTRTKTVTARWPSGIKDGGEFNFKAMD